jgi:predicted DNA-binding transcriptional regulator AlpA
MVNDQTKLLTSTQVAEILGITEHCLRRWRMLGTKGPKFIKLGERFIRYRNSDLEAWIEKQAKTPLASR